MTDNDDQTTEHLAAATVWGSVYAAVFIYELDRIPIAEYHHDDENRDKAHGFAHAAADRAATNFKRWRNHNGPMTHLTR